MTELPDTLHFSVEQLAAFLDGRLTTDERRRALAHFAACVACRREMTVARQLLAQRRATRRVPTLAVMSAIAATLAVVTLTRTARTDGTGESPVRAGERAPQPDRMPRLIVLSPDERAIADSVVVFRWRSAGADATYRLVVQDGTGSVTWDTRTPDTTVSLPRAISLTSGAQYFWSVDAQLADGSSASGGMHRFTAR